jgi:CRISP-associated protein Cas1
MTHFTESKPKSLEPISHPANLVVDQIGVFLGKRSERVLVRWKPPKVPSRSKIIRLANADADNHTTAIASSDDQGASPSVELANRLLSLWKPMEPQATSQERIDPAKRFSDALDEFADPATDPEESDTAHTHSHHAPISDVPSERTIPLCKLNSLTIVGGGITISSDLVAALVERGINLSFVARHGTPVAQVSAPGLNGTVQTRRAQLAAYQSPLGVELAVEFVRGKLRNQKHLLQYSGKYLKSNYAERFERLERKIASLVGLRRQTKAISATSLDSVRDLLMGYEGSGARLYWEGFAIVIEGRAEFPGRITRGATDPINAALNYGYGILYSQVSGAIVNAGLELYAGFLHVDRPGKPSLVLDMVEEFRAPIVDRAILSIVNQGVGLDSDHDGLTKAGRRLVAERVLERLESRVPFEGKQWPLSRIIQLQARHLAVAVRGERPYRSFASRW